MAYCRMGKYSDVYMYASVYGGYQFHLARSANGLEEGKDFNVPTLKEALHRMKRLKAQGYQGVDGAIERLEKEYNESIGEVP